MPSFRRAPVWLGILCAAILADCAPVDPGAAAANTAMTRDTHTQKFPILAGVHAAVSCDSCHSATANTFAQFTCLSCHAHDKPITDRLHTSQATYSYDSNACLSCHPAGAKVQFDHAGITGNCAQCHDAGNQFAALPVAGFTHPSMGGSDCSSCHSLPAPGSTTGWRNAAGAPATIAVGGFAISRPPATTAATQSGITGLPHPSVGAGMSCTTCHATSAGGKQAIGYDHASPLISSSCTACHEAGSDLVGTRWNGAATAASGAGDTRPFTLTSIVATSAGHSRTIANPNHFYSVDCAECHVVPTGVGATATGAAFTAAWQFPHDTTQMTNPSTCSQCHAGGITTPQYISVGGFAIPQPPASAPTTQSGVPNLPHPTVGSGVPCTTCHATSSGGRHAIGYDHASAVSSSSCAACHEAGSDLVGTPWNGAPTTASGAGDSRPFTLASVVASFHGNSRSIPYPNHFFPVDCHECHGAPSGISVVTTETPYTTAWRFPHTTSMISRPSTCVMCHTHGIP